MGLHDFTFYDLINRNAVAFRGRPAWFEAEDARTLTFAQFKERVDHLARGLQQHGVSKGDRIGVLAKNSLEYFLLFGASAVLGAIMLPVNWRLSADEVGFILNDGRPKVLFVDREYRELIQGLKGELLSIERYFGLGFEAEPFMDFKALLDNQGDLQPADVASDDGFVIIYTAAVAGRPRGGLLSHGNVLSANMHFDYMLSVTAKDV
jgi:long-chain acyl-CoA synthetase